VICAYSSFIISGLSLQRGPGVGGYAITGIARSPALQLTKYTVD